MPTPTCRRLVWVAFATLCTIFIPDFVLKYVGRMSTSDPIYAKDVFNNKSSYSGIHGKAVNWSYAADTNPMAAEVSKYKGYDVSSMFPYFMILNRSPGQTIYPDPYVQECIGAQNKSAQADQWLQYMLEHNPGYSYQDGRLVSCPYPNQLNRTGAPCYYSFDDLKVDGDIIYTPNDIGDASALPSMHYNGPALVQLDSTVLDVTDYLVGTTNVVQVSFGYNSRAFALDRMFLPLDLTTLLFLNLGNDITPYFISQNATQNSELYRKCLKKLFYKGVTSEIISQGCTQSNPALWATLGVCLVYFLVKMNLANLTRLQWVQRVLFASSTDTSGIVSWPHTILMIPCYSESSDIIKQTFDSLARTNYEDSKKLLLFVVDGVVRSATDAKETHLCILEALGHSITEDRPSHAYVSLGQGKRKINYAKVYAGFYETGRNRVPFVMVVKVGNPNEASVSRVPGNRGKRDSMVLTLGFLERCLNLANNRMTPLEYELFNQCYSVLGIDPRNFKYMLLTDADTQVQADVLHKLTSRLERDHSMLAVSGHVRPANPEQSIVTMLQIFPQYEAMYSTLAYEACFRSLTTINGSFVLYKLWSEEDSYERQHRSGWRNKIMQSSTNSRNTLNKWPKVSDEINPAQDSWDQSTTGKDSTLTRSSSHLSLSPNNHIRPYCIHPTVLRGFATPQADTSHMQNVLLLGEEQFFGIVLLRSHPHHRLGFEPEAIAYTTLPSTFFTLQGNMTRQLRAAFHNQLELQRVARHLGFSYWILAFTKLLDMIFSIPITVFLYSCFARAVFQSDLAYRIIAGGFAVLLVLHIVYFTVRRQFKYVMWFILYCIFSVPLFATWFPLLALWQNNYAEQWYDTWPTSGKTGTRLHGIIEDKKEKDVETPKKEEEIVEEEEARPDQQTIMRLRLGEFEQLEAEKAYYRTMEEAAALDANFTGFAGIVGNRSSVHSLRCSQSGGSQIIPSLPPAQLGDGYSSARSRYRPSTPVAPDMYGTTRGMTKYMNGDTLLPTQIDHGSPSGSMVNPFSSELDNPFDDSYAAHYYDMNDVAQHGRRLGKHKQSHSQSSYFSHLEGARIVPPAERQGRTRSHSTESVSVSDQHNASDRRSVYSVQSNACSLASSCLSLEMLAEPRTVGGSGRPRHLIGNERAPATVNQEGEGRSVAMHGRLGLTIPDRTNILRGFASGSAATATATAGALHRANIRSIHERNPSESSHPRQNTRDFRQVLRQAIRDYLSQADLDSTTRAQVKNHLTNLFGARIEEDDIQDFIHECIEQTTLTLLTQSS
ncbi:hypothetical protein EC973_004642 [Apophysomyces ossiformis]|uniref:chitin synthase n=1 Tax=Apophysomyces ossiformis TaxID=679940 RepID=A0A8H7BI37_9FUNG|nr:hypothetical protein EC973_004642 [Apophysomyces ossiformis]